MVDADDRTGGGDARLMASGYAPDVSFGTGSFDKPGRPAKAPSQRCCETSFSTESADQSPTTVRSDHPARVFDAKGIKRPEAVGRRSGTNVG
ncbi:hypothetical protein [Paraburkholderia tropica]|uniref:hypothetical protein n=1 Tax=Paraburkholderia tropica TaxID=92647 RepID=UPI000F54C7C9|nr:hypothetical protein [Paraburkholderia tropica]RQN33763.1 hypothetical protein EHZ25_38080 [Paraburkholderia tropica]